MAKKESKEEEKELSPEEALKYFDHINQLNGMLKEGDKYADDIRDELAHLDKKGPLDYAKLTTQGVSKKLKVHAKKALVTLKETLTYDWLLKNKPAEEIIKYLYQLPDLKDKNNYKTIFEAAEQFREAFTAEDREGYVRKYYGNKINELKKKKDIKSEIKAESIYADLYSAASNTEYLDAAYGGIVAALKYELQQEVNKYAPKKKTKITDIRQKKEEAESRIAA